MSKDRVFEHFIFCYFIFHKHFSFFCVCVCHHLDVLFRQRDEQSDKERWQHLADLADFALAMKVTLMNINYQSFNNFMLRIGTCPCDVQLCASVLVSCYCRNEVKLDCLRKHKRFLKGMEKLRISSLL